MRSEFVYVGIDPQGKPQLVISQEKLSPVGARLKRGNDFSQAVYEFYQHHNPIVTNAIKSMEAFLRGEDGVSEKLEFGQSIKTRKRK